MLSEAGTRSRATRLSTLVALCLAGGLMLTPQGRTHAGHGTSNRTESPAWFHGKLSEAQAEAKERNIPLIVCCVLEGEEASGRFQEALSEDDSLSSLGAEVILVLANNGDHEQK
ncbi:MAG: hypothetical protein QGI93_06890, partial [Planctomycetota bacterium]|nr:hypothetical protein [Planctomycetota bacterium]